VYFKLTKCGIDYYESIFGTEYPFGKLDQIFVPEYNMGAMENVGSIVLSDTYIQREELFTDFKK